MNASAVAVSTQEPLPADLLPENILVAVFNRVGRRRIRENIIEAACFDAAQRAKVFEHYRPASHTGSSNRLWADIRSAVVGATLERFADDLVPSVHTAGEYGRGIYNRFTSAQRAVIDEVARKIQDQSREL